MKTLILVPLVSTLIFFSAGCGSSEETSSKQEVKPPLDAAAQKPAETPLQQDGRSAARIDTLNVDVKDTPKPVYDARSSVPAAGSAMPTGKFSVQIGAYKMPDNAERVASLARERFGKNVYTIADKTVDLYKVYLGDFAVKEDARKFRDEMVQRYPNDYKDAWVSENPQK